MSGTHVEHDRARVERQLEWLTDELTERFRGVFGESTVYRYVLETYTLLSQQATVRTHLMNLTAHFTSQRLADSARAHGRAVSTVPQVLFVCVHNIGRSQMAAALLEYHAQGRVIVRSAGSAPAGSIPQAMTTALGEWGINVVAAYPKPLTDEVVRAADVVVTLGCGDACPVLPERRYLDWTVADPTGCSLDEVRRIRDDLNQHVLGLLEDLQ